MAKNKKFMASTGFVGLTALALTVSPAFANPQTEVVSDTDKDRAIVYEVENLGDSFSVLAEDLTLPENIDSSSLSAAVENTAENVVVEDILDENDVKTGDKTVLVIDEQGTWSFETDLEGNLVKVDFVPVEGFEGDPILDYVAGDKEEEITGTITLDYPNDEKAEDVKPLTDEELAALEKEEAEKAEAAKLAEENTSDKTVEVVEIVEPAPIVEPVPVVEELVEDSNAVKDEVVEGIDPEVEKEPMVRVQARTFAAPGLIVSAPAAPIAPAAPVAAEGLDPNFTVPDLNGQSNGNAVTLTFGDNGEKLPAGADASTVNLIIGTGADQESTLSSNNKQLEIPNVGTFKVNGDGNSFVFEPVSGYSGTAIGHYVVQDTTGNFSNEGRLIVGVSPAGNNAEPDVAGEETPENAPEAGADDQDVVSDTPVSSGDPLAEDPTLSNDSVENSQTTAEASRDNLSKTGVDSAPVGIAAAALALLGGGFAVLSSRLKKDTK